MSRPEMIEYLSKEIETLSTNTMNMRNRISFSLWIGPFLVLGSIVVVSQRNGFSLSMRTPGAWVAAVSAALGFWALGYMTGEVEAGAWKKCNEWRRCIIKLQSEEEVAAKELESLILYEPIVQKITQVYSLVFLIIIIIFVATAYLATQL
jgi:hypothetical protein